MKKLSICFTIYSFILVFAMAGNLLLAQNLQQQNLTHLSTRQQKQTLYALDKSMAQHEQDRLRKIIYGKIKGQVIDAESKEPLPGTNVLIVGTQFGAAADLNGFYEINGVPPGKYQLRVSMMGYRMIEREITVYPEQTVLHNFALQESVLEAEAIVVTATGTPHFYKDTPVKTTVIPRKLMESRGAENLADALALQTGIRVETDCQNCNFTQVRLLGLEGHYSQILIEGDPVVSSLAGVYGLEQIPEEMIERIEIVKGGGSALYGGSAVAGVINLITRRPSGNKFKLNIRNAAIRGTFENQVGFTTSRVNKAGNSGVYIFGSLQRRTPMDYNGDGFSEIGKLANESAGFSWYFHPAQQNEFFMHFHHIHEKRRGGNKFDLPPHKADIAEAIQSWRWGGTLRWKHKVNALLNYKTYFSFAYQKRSSYYGAYQDPNAYGQTQNPLYVTGIQMNYKIANHLLSYGLQYQREELNDIALAYNRIIQDVYTDMGIFLQDNLHFVAKDWAEIIYGVRFDKHSKIRRNIYSPRVGMRIKLADVLTFRGGFSTGFKPPQIFDEDLHITQVGGEGQIIKNADNLKEEKSLTYTCGMEYQDILDNMPVRFGVNFFLTKLSHTFLLNKQDDPATDEVEFYRINGKGATVKGLEIDLGLRFLSATELRGGITIQKSRWDEPDPDFSSFSFFRTPDLYGYLRLSTDINKTTNVLISANYTGRMWVPHYVGYIPVDCLEHSQPFLELDCHVSCRVSLFKGSQTRILMGIQNINNSYQKDFDTGIDRDAGYIYGPSHPRRFLLGISSSL